MPSNVCNPWLPIPGDCHGYSCSLHQRLLLASSAELLRIAQALSQAQEGELQGRMEFLAGTGEEGDEASRTGGKQLMDVPRMEGQQHLLLSAVLLAPSMSLPTQTSLGFQDQSLVSLSPIP